MLHVSDERMELEPKMKMLAQSRFILMWESCEV